MHFPLVRVRLLRVALLACTLYSSHFLPPASAQRPPAQPNAAEILHRMQKLQVLGSVLYIVAHPDDENTRLIAWLANGKKVRTGNLSLTRGDGGQNLIGPELGDALGIIRTQELMEARRIDGGEQFFTRAVDFGYSKSAEESFEKWGKQEVLSDVVRVIRLFRPDIIITRFPTDGGGGHGHHTASAILAHEAFDLAGDPKAFPEQLKQGLEVWQPRRLFFNGSSWWRRDLAEFAKTDPDWFTVDVGGYDPLLGLSYTEIAGRSRSMHKSQGFGAAETRGEMLEYLHFEKGDRPKTKDIFEGIDMTWEGRRSGAAFAAAMHSAIDAYDFAYPSKSIASLSAALDLNKHGNLHPLLLDLSAMSAEATAPAPTLALGDSCEVSIAFTGRSDVPAKAIFAAWSKGEGVRQKYDFDALLSQNSTTSFKRKLIAAGPVDEPFWLKERREGALYNLSAAEGLIGYPVAAQEKTVDFKLDIQNIGLQSERPLLYKWVDRVDGERTRPVYITPVASVIPKTDVVIARGGPQSIIVEVEALTDGLFGHLYATLPEGWSLAKGVHAVSIEKRGDRQALTFQLIPSDKAQHGAVRFEFNGPKGKADRTLHEIDYPHIMPQVYYTPAEVKLVPLDVSTTAKTVGYIKGAGDEVPEAIEQLGVKVDIVDPATASPASLKKYDAIVTGIRAYNTVKELKTLNAVLMKYVEEGGTLVCQYNTRSSDMVLPDSLFGPYPFKLTRDRVTVEEAPPTFLKRDHPLLKTPNAITAADFDGWVQERGLYFCGSLDPHYTTLIAWNDPGEQPLNGGLITCDYGKGRYVYTGISFFRQLPAGVPGAYRLFANLISKRE